MRFKQKLLVLMGKRYSSFKKKKMGDFANGSDIVRPSLWYSKAPFLFLGENSIILSNSRIQQCPSNSNDNPIIRIGNNCFFGYFLTLLAGEDIVIGNDVLIASNVIVTSENHSVDPESEIPYMSQPLIGKKVTIGDGCWIGEKVIILPGVTIGEKSVIGGGSVVTKDVPSYAIAVGNPARVIKKYNFETHKWENVCD